MSKPKGALDAIAIWVVSIFAGVVGFALTQSIFILFFAPIIVGVLWDSTNKVNRLEKRLSEVEARLSSERKGASKTEPYPQS
jgi:hypothetical protein